MCANKIDCPLPKEQLPDCWFDNERMNALYAPFRSSNVNSEDRNSKIKFWKKFITNYCVHKNLCSYSITDLKKCLKRDGRPPGCLESIIEEMFKNGDIQKEDKFMLEPTTTWSGWAVNVFVKSPVSWSFNKMKDSIVASTDEFTKFIDVKAVQAISEKIFQTIQEQKYTKLVDFVDLLKVIQQKHDIDEVNLKYVLHHLKCERKIATKEHMGERNLGINDNVTLIKIAPKNQKVTPINEIEISVYSLEKHEAALAKAVEELEAEKEQLVKEAKVYVSKGMRTMAKSCLRKKHAVEKCIEKRSGVLENVQLLLAQVIEAEYNKQVVDTFKEGVSAFKSTFKEAGLDEDNVSQVICDVQEMLDINQEVQESLGQNLTTDVDNSDLEEELAELLAAGSTPPDHNIGDLKLPDVAADDTEIDFELQHKELERRLHNLQMGGISQNQQKAAKDSI